VRAEALRPQPDLGGGLLAGDVERAPARGREVAERHVRERGLADARRAAEEHERAGDEAAAEHAVELADARVEARRALDPDVAQRDRLPGGRRARPAEAARPSASPAGRARRRRALLDER